jgi:hypothetical protein
MVVTVVEAINYPLTMKYVQKDVPGAIEGGRCEDIVGEAPGRDAWSKLGPSWCETGF